MKDRVLIVLLVVLVITALLEWLIFEHASPKFAWHYWPGYTVVIALVAASAIGWTTKAWLAPLLQVPDPQPESDLPPEPEDARE